MKLSVVVPTYNRRRILARVLPTVFHQDFPADEREVVMVVDGSSDGTLEFLHALQPPCSIRVITQPNRGPASARNAGIEAARGELVLFLDDDVLCDPALLRTHVAAHEAAEPGVVFGPVLVAPESRQSLATDWISERLRDYAARLVREKGPGSPFDVWFGCNCSVPRSLLLTRGGYDESFCWAAEDAEHGMRLWAAGVPFRFEPGASVCQVYDKSLYQLASIDAPRLGAGEVLLCRKYPDYRPHSRLALSVDSRLRRILAPLCCRSPIPPGLPLWALLWVAERLRFVPAIRRAGIGLVKQLRGIGVLRGAVRELESWEAFRGEFGMSLPVLLYHHVGPPRAGVPPELTVTPERFERQLQGLRRRGYVAVQPSDWLAWRLSRKALPRKPLVISFDDDCADIANYALPIVRRCGFKAVVYATTAHLHEATASQETQCSMAHRPMSAEQVRRWKAEGIEFGLRGRRNVDLTTLTPNDLEEEVFGSRQELAAILSDEAVSFAYPQGEQNHTVRECVAKAFACAFTREPGLNVLSSDPFLMRRVWVRQEDGAVDLAWRMKVGWSFAPFFGLRSRILSSIPAQ